MDSLPSLRLTVMLNAMIGTPVLIAEAAERVVGGDVAHHVVDPDHLLAAEPAGDVWTLAAALPLLSRREPEMWVLALPVPGALGVLRGPVALNRAALETGEAVIAQNAGLALVPHRVGPAVQWRAYAAERPFAPPAPGEAERELNEAVLEAGAALARLDVAAGAAPRRRATATLAPGYPTRQQATADRAARLLAACSAALENDGAALSAYEADLRFRELRRVRSAAGQALCAAASWIAPGR